MTFQANGIEGAIGLDERPAFRSLDAVEKHAREFKGKVDQTMAGVQSSMGKAAKGGEGAFAGFIDRLKGNFGKKSVFGDLLEIGAGSGAIAALGIATSKFKDLTEAVQENAAALRTGEKGFADIAQSIARSIPVLGDAAQGFVNLWDAASGQAGDRAEQDADTARRKKQQDDLQAALKGGKSLADTYRDSIRGLNHELATLNTVQEDLPAFQHQFSRDDLVRGFKKQFVDAAKEIGLSIGSPEDFDNLAKTVGTGPLKDKVLALRGAYEQLQESIRSADALLARQLHDDAVDRAFNSFRDAAQEPFQQIEQLWNDTGDDMITAVQQLHAALQTPAEGLVEQFNTLKQLSELLDDQTFERAVNKAKADFSASFGPQSKSVQAVELRGTPINTSDASQSPLKQLPPIAQQTLDEIRGMRREAAARAAAVKAGPSPILINLR
jgi:hypothetical protein